MRHAAESTADQGHALLYASVMMEKFLATVDSIAVLVTGPRENVVHFLRCNGLFLLSTRGNCLQAQSVSGEIPSVKEAEKISWQT